MDLTAGIGLLAGLLTTASLIPQALKIWKSKSAKDISLKMFAAFSVGVGLWLLYGILQKELPIIVWNAVSLVLAGAILAMKLRFR
jgi:MtN3 and saliva related transmembrane protein